MTRSNSLKLGISLAIPLLVGAISGYFTAPQIEGWYSTLNQPSFNPPNWIFGPVWVTLYVIMGISLFLVWKQPESSARNRALVVFSVQLIFNFTWSFIFFYNKMMALALVDIVMLWISIVTMLICFKKVKRVAAYLNVPYLLWVSFATALNAAYLVLNP